MFHDFIEDELSRQSIFRAEEFLSIDYVPEHLPHREEELRTLLRGFKTLISAPGRTSPRFVIEGPVGTGKTAVAKRFSEELVTAARKRGVRLHGIHINCRVNKSPFLVYLRVLREFRPDFPRRGHSPEELLQIILDTLDEQDRYVLLILDEFDYFIINPRGQEILYALTRLVDDRLNEQQRISLLLIGRDLQSSLGTLDYSTLSTLQHNSLRFQKYSAVALYDILHERVALAFQDGVVLDDTLHLICDIAAEYGDARYAIELLCRAGKQAEQVGSDYVVPEFVRKAKADTHPELRKEVFESLPLHNKLLLLAAARQLRGVQDAYVTMGDVEDMYRTVCEEYNQAPRAHTQIWEWVQDFAAHGILDTKKSGPGQRGQTTLIGLSDLPAEMLEQFLLQLIEE